MSDEITLIKKRNPIVVFFWVAGLTILIQVLSGIGFVIAGFMNDGLSEDIINDVLASTSSSIFIGIFSLIICIPCMILITKYLWRRDNKWMGLLFNSKMLLSGFAFGLLLPVIIVMIIAITGTINVQFNPYGHTFTEMVTAFFGLFGIMAFIGYEEEVIFRGMLIREWASRGNLVIAAVIGGIIFGAIHIFNIEDVTLYVAVNITLSGLFISSMLVAMYIRFGSLWISIGFHTGWNFIIIAVLGTPVSGITTQRSLFSIKLDGPIWLTGGQYGIEISFITSILVLAATFLIVKYPFNKKINFMDLKIPYQNKSKESE